MATHEKRGDSYRIIVFDGYDAYGKQIRRTKTWHPPEGLSEAQIRTELKRQEVEFEDSIKGSAFRSPNIKFQILADEYIDQLKKENKKKQLYIERLEDCKERTYEAIGHLAMQKINYSRVQNFINSLAENGVNKITGGGLSTKTQRQYISFISIVFEYAEKKCGIAVKNPTKGISPVITKAKKGKVFTLEEAQNFYNLMKSEPIKYQAFFAIAGFLGLRKGEILGLEWQDIDLKNGILMVRRESVYSKKNGTITSSTKTVGSVRTLKMPKKITTLLERYKEWQDGEIEKAGDQWEDNGRLFTQWNGKPMGPDTARHWIEKFCKKNGIDRVNVHSFRHFAASALISSGIDVRTVSDCLGHAQTSTTLNIYAEAFAYQKALAAEAVAEKIGVDL